jgi:hypothetical protein
VRPPSRAAARTVILRTHRTRGSVGNVWHRSAGHYRRRLRPSTSYRLPRLSATPPYLAEKILHSKTALQGERKQVTVLFADLKRSMESLADRDPEETERNYRQALSLATDLGIRLSQAETALAQV